MIDSYSFGRMQVDGKTHTNDLKIFPDHVRSNWWRDEGHLLQVQDIEDVLEENPKLLIIGQGAHGRMKISPEVKEKLEEEGIRYIGKKTDEAVELYNQEEDNETIGIFHLTC